MHARAREKSETSRSAPAARRPQQAAGSADVQRVLSLQRTIGNQAVQAMMQSHQSHAAAIQRVPDPWPPVQWDAEIQGLNQGNAPLGPENRGIRQLRQNNPGLVTLIDNFVASLLDPDQNANQADAILRQMLELIPSPGAAHAPQGPGRRPPSRFPVNLYTTLKEIINAKRAWLGGDQTLHPWPFDASALKPDYLVGEEPADPGEQTAEQFYENTQDVGDHVMVSGRGNIEAVLSNFAANVADKVRTYPGKNVRVIVDVSDNHTDELHLPDAASTLRSEFRARLGERSNVSPQLMQVDVVLPGGNMIKVYDRAGSPPPEATAQPEQEVQVVTVSASPVIDALASSSTDALAPPSSSPGGDVEAQVEAQQEQAPATLLARLRNWFARLWRALLNALGRS